jgi:hypothetical protein
MAAQMSLFDGFDAAVSSARPPRVLVCGSRDLAQVDVPLVREHLRKLPRDTIVVHGDQGIVLADGTVLSGADKLAAEVAKELGLAVEAHPALWTAFGKGAGLRRNTEMVESGVCAVLAFWDLQSPGTADTIRKARGRSIPVRIVVFEPVF